MEPLLFPGVLQHPGSASPTPRSPDPGRASRGEWGAARPGQREHLRGLLRAWEAVVGSVCSSRACWRPSSGR